MTSVKPSLLMTGASGFIGRHLLGKLKSSHRIIAVARRAPERLGAPRAPNIEWIHADIGASEDMAALRKRIAAAGGVDLVVLLAAYYDFTGRDAPEYHRTNVVGMRKVLEMCKEISPRRLIFASSAAACDFTRRGSYITEESPADGENRTPAASGSVRS